MRARSTTINFLLGLSVCLAGAALPLFAHAQEAAQACTGTCDGNNQCIGGTGTCAAPVQAPESEPAAELSSQGIFGCLGQGARVANVGTTRAIGGVYVPVNDAAVTLNTGFLVYKECILDGMSRRIAQSGTAELGRQQLEAFQTGGAGGGTQYLRNWESFLTPRLLQSATVYVQGLQTRCGAFCDTVPTAVARSAAQGLGVLPPPASTISPAAVAAMQGSTGQFNWTTFTGMTRGYHELGQYNAEMAGLAARQGALAENLRSFITMGNGVIPTFDNNPDPLAMNIVTPGTLIAGAISQTLGSGYRQLENAQEIDQIVTNLFAGLTARIVGSPSGVPGLFTASGGQPAYIDRMVAQTQASVRSGAVNAAVNILAAARQTQALFLEARQGTAQALINTVVQLRSYESQCWDLIIPAVQAHAQSNGNPTLTIATSTQFSTAVIDNPTNNLRELASTTAAEVTAAQQAVQAIEQIIASVTNTNSTAEQQQALIQLDQMVAAGQLRSAEDAQAASDQRATIVGALATLLENTKAEWADSQDANVGWCNINNPAVIERWFNAWR